MSGSCALACTADAQCPTGDYCDQGACVLNTQPSSNCTVTSDCDTGQVCQSGFCVYTCTTSTQCAEIDARIPVCVDNVCRAGTPQCTTQADCPEGEDCIDNTCR